VIKVTLPSRAGSAQVPLAEPIEDEPAADASPPEPVANLAAQPSEKT
jgi:hypothetical protein